MSLQAGIAKVNITPPVGVYLTGFGNRKKPSMGVKLPLKAKCLLLKDEKEKVALISADLIGLGRRVVKEVRSLVKEKTGIENLVILCTHTHAGPETSNLINMAPPDEAYLNILPRTLAGSVLWASQNMKEVKVGCGRGRADGLTFNRRQKTFTPVDEEVNVLKIKGEDLLVHLINYTCHAVVSGPQNLLIYSDYPGETQRYAEEYLGGIAIFTNGCCGNIDPICYYYKWGGGTFAESERMGKIIAAEALKISLNTEVSPGKLLFKRKEVKLPLRWPSLKEAEKLCREARDYANRHKGYAQNVVKWSEDIFKKVKEKETPPFLLSEISLLSLNDIALIFLPGEIYVQIGQKIKKESPFSYTLISGYTDEIVGYIASEDDFEEDWLKNNSPVWYWGPYFFHRSVEEVVIRECLSLLKSSP
ncbi:neutral/alkaline non-lysosomal ceramidase N-terminal domain-containing protein [Candidatus Aerophobetes bacterium]|nr:neutral/alkaline non-lysosomal ceramidase N-terminal domain-containing protein [Candidatus Aerophobetes bacterium]